MQLVKEEVEVATGVIITLAFIAKQEVVPLEAVRTIILATYITLAAIRSLIAAMIVTALDLQYHMAIYKW